MFIKRKIFGFVDYENEITREQIKENLVANPQNINNDTEYVSQTNRKIKFITFNSDVTSPVVDVFCVEYSLRKLVDFKKKNAVMALYKEVNEVFE